MTFYAQLAKIDAQGHSPEEQVEVREQFEAGILLWSEFLDVIAYGRSLGIDIEVHRGGGWLVRRGHVVITGAWGPVRTFLLAWARLAHRDEAS